MTIRKIYIAPPDHNESLPPKKHINFDELDNLIIDQPANIKAKDCQDHTEADNIKTLLSFYDNEPETVQNENNDFDLVTTKNTDDYYEGSLIDRFVEEDIPDLMDVPIEKKMDNNSIENSDLIKVNIISHYKNIIGFLVEDNYPEIKIIYKNGYEDFIIIIDIDDLNQEVIIKIFIEFHEDVAIAILKQWSKIKNNLSFSIDEYMLAENFVIKRYVDIKKHQIKEIISIIDYMIKTAKLLCLIIKKQQ